MILLRKFIASKHKHTLWINYKTVLNLSYDIFGIFGSQAWWTDLGPNIFPPGRPPYWVNEFIVCCPVSERRQYLTNKNSIEIFGSRLAICCKQLPRTQVCSKSIRIEMNFRRTQSSLGKAFSRLNLPMALCVCHVSTVPWSRVCLSEQDFFLFFVYDFWDCWVQGRETAKNRSALECLSTGKKNNVTVVGKDKPYCTYTASFAKKEIVTDMLKVMSSFVSLNFGINEYDPEGPWNFASRLLLSWGKLSETLRIVK